MELVGEIAARLARVRGRIDEACAAAGRDPAGVRLLPVSKTQPAEAVRAAFAAGMREFGENKPQELAAKADELGELDGLRWAAIGHLQTNKAKLVAEHASEFHALDSVRVAEALDRRLQALGRGLDVFVQVNSSGEESKFGLAPAQVAEFAAALAPYHALRVVGLMTLAANTDDPARVAGCFASMQQLQRELREGGVAGEWDELSMGMSGDFAAAIAHGATVIRIGTAIFGAREVA